MARAETTASYYRDIKPENIIKLNDPARPFVLLDLGIAFVIGETALTNAGIPATNVVFNK